MTYRLRCPESTRALVMGPEYTSALTACEKGSTGCELQ